jgi:hypothetical protein
MKPIDLRIAEELGIRAQQVAAAIALLDSPLPEGGDRGAR